jgi:hypothetical protein
MARLGGSGSSWPHLELQAVPYLQPEALRLRPLEPDKEQNDQTTSTMLINIAVPNLVPLPDSPSFVVEDYSADPSLAVIIS